MLSIAVSFLVVCYIMTAYYSNMNIEKRCINVKELSLHYEDLILLSGSGLGVAGQLFINGAKILLFY